VTQGTERIAALPDGAPSVEAFLETYRGALERLDLDTVVASYRVPLPVTRPDRLRVVEDVETLRDEIRRILDFYAWAGMTRVEMLNPRIDGFDPGLIMASLTWRPIDEIGAEIARIDQTFAIRAVRGGCRIAAVIAHNEERNRTPIIRESLNALEKDA
jgi:hypothetical protein